MKLEFQGDTAVLRNIDELSVANSRTVRARLSATLTHQHRNVVLDLSSTRFMDSCGLGVLIWLRRFMADRNGCLSLQDPAPSVLLLLGLTRLEHSFNVTHFRSVAPALAS